MDLTELQQARDELLKWDAQEELNNLHMENAMLEESLRLQAAEIERLTQEVALRTRDMQAIGKVLLRREGEIARLKANLSYFKSEIFDLTVTEEEEEAFRTLKAKNENKA